MDVTKRTLLDEIRQAASEAPRMYFAPLIGAVRGIRAQYRSIDTKRHRKPPKPPGSGTIRGL